MVKLVYCLRRLADVSPEEFYRYWLNTHAPKVKDAAEAMRALRYVQSHTCEAELNQAFVALRGLAPAYDGITEVWWNSIEDLKAAMATPVAAEAMALLQEDESHFIDFSQSCVFMTTEHLIFDRS
ncbi:MAG TPA: EthD domain-containing protein [Chthoniobacterales bacterium]|nr:EthD domain-containing protein [Chthoniobacterales bacterium]